jgi:hypothetical protein
MFMPEKPKDQTTVEENICDDVPETGDESSWSEDIDKHDYYYDDAHGYEVYDPDTEEGGDDLVEN